MSYSRKQPISSPHFSISQLRIDLWNELKIHCDGLRRSNVSEVGKDTRESIDSLFEKLKSIERYYTTPGSEVIKHIGVALNHCEYSTVSRLVAKITSQLVGEDISVLSDESDLEGTNAITRAHTNSSKYFEVLFVENLDPHEKRSLKKKFRSLVDENENLHYEVNIQPSFQDALIALQLNHSIQAVVIRYAPEFYSMNITKLIEPYIQNVLNINLDDHSTTELGPLLGKYTKKFRPELDLYYVTDTSLNDLKDDTLSIFRRIYYRKEDLQELHLGILTGIKERYRTDFFTALKKYSQTPTGVFHAMPISRGNSVFKSRWIQDFGEFYGRNLFLAETSATTGGLDSLLQPTGSLKKAQEMAAQAYGSQRTYFVTNGTSTSNKIVLQSLVKPGDLVLIDRDCHKSHHYGLVLSGAHPVYLDSFPIEKYSMYGAVPLEHIVEKLKQLKAAGRLDKVKMLILTNCTFDGLVYHTEKVMERILAIKPDMIFLWDEAWFGFAGFTQTYRQRTAMHTAKKLHSKYRKPSYKRTREHLKKKKNVASLPPDPDKIRIRVYATQSTHKTLSSFRQGSMIHIWDEDFSKKSEANFQEAYMTHTSTSPNYQILASLDIGRRQVQFEGYEMVEKSLEMAMLLRSKIDRNKLLRKYFDVLTVQDFIPEEYRPSNINAYYDQNSGWNRMEKAWEMDEFVLDPTKITLFIGRTGVDGDTFKNRFLMDKYNIQINKTSRNTILLMTNIGTTRGSVAYLTNCLLQIAHELEEQDNSLQSREVELKQNQVKSLTETVPPLPDFSAFHPAFQPAPGVPGGNLRAAYFMAYDESHCEYRSLEECEKALTDGEQLVASSFVIPYPPGFPVLVPGQIISNDILRFMLELDVKEIHGYRPDLGLKIFKKSVLKERMNKSSLPIQKKKDKKPLAEV